MPLESVGGVAAEKVGVRAGMVMVVGGDVNVGVWSRLAGK